MAEGPSRRAVLLSALAVLAAGAVTFSAVITQTGYLFRNDGTAYFLYARSLVVDRDVDVTPEYRVLNSRLPADSPVMMAVRYSARPVPGTDCIVFPWPAGTGWVTAPFYALGYAVERAAAWRAGRAPDSFGVAPQLGYGLGSLAFGLLGFWATWLCCRRAAGDLGGDPFATTAAAHAVVLGGPAVFYVLFHPTMSHAPSFGLVALLVLLWWRRWEGEGPPFAVLWLLLGLLVFVRYQNAVFAILPLSLLPREVARLRRVRRSPGRASISSAAGGTTGGLACLLPIVLIVLTMPGEPGGAPRVLTFAQNDLDLRSPHFFQVLFSCQHGAFYWAPVLGLGFAGLLWAARGASWARVLALVFLADVYLTGTLEGMGGTNWSGGHAFGMRYLTECAPLLAAGLAVLVRRTAGATAGELDGSAGTDRSRRRRRLVWAGVLGLLVAGNGLLILAYGAGEISHSGCVTYGEMAAGAARALAGLFTRMGGG
jgi:hypothetical protein